MIQWRKKSCNCGSRFILKKKTLWYFIHRRPLIRHLPEFYLMDDEVVELPKPKPYLMLHKKK